MNEKEPTLAEKNDIDASDDQTPAEDNGVLEDVAHDVDAGDASEDSKPTEYSIDTDLEYDEAAESAGEEDPVPAHKLSRKEVLTRLMEKNQLLVGLNKDKIALERQLRELNDKWLRSVAEFENYRKRTRKEWELLKQQSKSEVILEVLNVVDDFERAFSVAEDSESSEFIQGIKLIYNNLLQVLDRFGVGELDAIHQPFDPNFHMAVGQVESKRVDSGIVAEVVQKGYHLDDIVIRPSRVIVAK